MSRMPELVLEISELNNRWNKLALEEAEQERRITAAKESATSKERVQSGGAPRESTPDQPQRPRKR
jgi:hypothetical protein